MTVEDRLRATSLAVTDTMRQVRPLTLPPALDRATRRRRRPRPPHRWPPGRPGWLMPLAAGVAVIAVAVSLVLVRDLPSTPKTGSPTSSGGGLDALAAMPRYAALIPMEGGTSDNQQNLVVADTYTGRQLFKAIAPAGQAYTGVTGAADDRTFVADLTSTAGQGKHTFFVLRITPGAAHPVTAAALRPLLLPSSTQVLGFAVSPDTRTLAVMFQADAATTPGPATLRTYSLATGKPLHTWTGKPASTTPGNRGLYGVDGQAMLSWLDDGKTLAIRSVYLTKTATVFLLDTTRPGTSLLNDSRPVFTGAKCGDVLITPDGRTVFCPVPGSASGAAEPAFVTYSTTTGQREQVIYSGEMEPADSSPLWAGSATMAVVIMYDVPVTSPTGRRGLSTLVGVITPGKFTPLRINLGSRPIYFQGTMAF